MRNDPNPFEPSPADLAAFLDGELDPPGRARVEAWLSTRPDAAGELEGQRRLLRRWADNPPPEPGPAAWALTRDRIETALARPPARRARRWARPLWLGAGAAAALAAAALLTRFFLPGAPPRLRPTNPPVVSAPTKDTADPPILLAGQDDVSVMSLAPYPNDDGRVPQIGEGEVPMIVAPSLARAGAP